MTNVLLIVELTVAIIAIILLIETLATRFGGHHTSRLTCPNCGKQFDYRWLPGGTFTVLRHTGSSRSVRCPKCNQPSTFDLWSTRVGGKESAKGN